MNIVNIDDVDVCTEGPSYQLELLILSSYFADQVFSLFVHGLQQVLQKLPFIVNPGCLIFDMTNGISFRIADN